MRLRRTEQPERSFTPNQVVAQRIVIARELRGWTQEEAAERLEPFLGARWSGATFSIVERSVDGKRIRQFSADELVALSPRSRCRSGGGSHRHGATSQLSSQRPTRPMDYPRS